MKKLLLITTMLVAFNAQAGTTIQQAKQAVKEVMVDPSSAQFKDLFVVNGDMGQIVCGSVNGRNGFGGYTGYQHFIAIGNGAVVFDPSDEDPRLGPSVWSQKCGR